LSQELYRCAFGYLRPNQVCTACHGDFAINITGSSVVATGLPSGSYVPGQAYNFSIKITHPTAINTIWGFAIKAVNTTEQPGCRHIYYYNANASVKGSVGNQDLELSHSTAATSQRAATTLIKTHMDCTRLSKYQRIEYPLLHYRLSWQWR